MIWQDAVEFGLNVKETLLQFWEGFCTKSPLNSLNTVLFSLQRNLRDENQWKMVEDDKHQRKTLLKG